MSATGPYNTFPVHGKRPNGKKLALEGVRVVDFTRYLAGPWCTQALADLGAEVIKIEAPGTGDETRTYKPPEVDGESPYFLGLNRNKKSIVLNLATDMGKQIARDLVAVSDIVVENFSPGVMKRLGLGYEELTAVNPRLIYCAVNAWGSESSYADQPGFDSVFQAESGFASLTGDPDRLPMRTGTPIIDITTSMNATSAVLAALFAREKHGVGQYVEVALFDTAITLLAYFSMNYLASGIDPVRNGNTAPVATPIGMFETSDNQAIYVSCGSQRSWEKLATGVLKRPDLVAEPKYVSNRDRNRNQSELMELLADIFKTKPRDHWLELSHRERVPVGAVRSVAEALHAPMVIERKIVTRVNRGDGTSIPNISSPFRFAETPVADPIPAPRLDENRDEILSEVLKYTPENITDCVEAGAFEKSGGKGI